MRFLIGLLGVTLVGCAANPPKSVVLSLENLTCVDCAEDLQQVVAPYSGVLSMEFRQAHAELLLAYDSRITTPLALEALFKAEGYRTQLGPGTGYYLGGDRLPSFGDVAWVDQWNWEEAGVPGKVTVFQREDPYCQTCDDFEAVLKTQLGENEDIALRRVRGEPHPEYYALVYDSVGRVVDRLTSPQGDRLAKAIEVARTLK